MLGYILLDKLQQHVGHVRALGGSDRLEAVVEFDGNVQIHALHLWLFSFFDFPHLLSEMRLSGYEYGALLHAPGVAAQQNDPGHGLPLDIQGRGDQLQLLLLPLGQMTSFSIASYLGRAPQNVGGTRFPLSSLDIFDHSPRLYTAAGGQIGRIV